MADPYWFDETYYLTQKLNDGRLFGEYYSDINTLKFVMLQAGFTPYHHFLAFGDAENLNPNAFFDRTEYLEAKAIQMTAASGKEWTANDVADSFVKAGVFAAQHYANWGWKENLNPSNYFDTSAYLLAKQTQLHQQPGVDWAGRPYATYSLMDTIQSLALYNIDPVGHYLNFGFQEKIQSSSVPTAEQVTWDPSRTKAPILSSDGETITLTFPSLVIAESIEAADFTLSVGDKTYTIKGAAPGDTDFNVVLTLESKLPQNVGTVYVNYDPNGGNKTMLTCERGNVTGFKFAALNESLYYNIIQNLSSDHKTLTVATFPGLTAESSFNIDMSATTGVISVPADGLGIVVPPILEDGSLVQNLDASNINKNISLNITARKAGGEITSGQGADSITLGTGADQLNYKTYTSSNLNSLDTVKNFTMGADKINFSATKTAPVFGQNVLSLAGVVSEETINAVLSSEQNAANKAFLIKDGTSYLLMINDNIARYEAGKDFLLRLDNFTINSNIPLADIIGTLADTTPVPKSQVLIAKGDVVQITFPSPLVPTSLDLADFNINMGSTNLTLTNIAVSKDSPFVLELTLANPLPHSATSLQVTYNSAGGDKAALACVSGLVPDFRNLTIANNSLGYYITERLTTEDIVGGTINTLVVSATPSSKATTDSMVNIDLSAEDGVVSVEADQPGILTSPQLLDGSKVNNLDASAVAVGISLNITARKDGGEITSGKDADSITLGTGTDQLNYASHTTSQLWNMDTVIDFEWGIDKIKFATSAITYDATILNLVGVVNEATINAAIGDRNGSNKAFLLMDGEDYILVINDSNPAFEASMDFALRLNNLTGVPDDTTTWGEELFA